MSKNALITKAKDPTHAIFGVKLDGTVLHIPISEGPHWIICGQTGSGKSVFINGLLISTLYHATPEELIIQWIDPKKVEAAAYVGLPFCPNDPITNMKDAYGYVAYLTWLMDERYEQLERTKTKKIDEFNEWVEQHPQEAEELGFERMPYFILVIDEYADMVMQTPDVEKNLIRLGQKSRACGIHLLIATQRPSADIVTPTLKSNIPSRVGLKTVDSVNSMIVIDEAGCEELKGYGDALVKDVAGDITRCQGPYISNEEIDRIFAHLRERFKGRNYPEIDYKSKVVELGLCAWEDSNYTDDVPMKDRHVVPVRRSRF